jgi:iron complex transport system substrate-binding protein
MVAGWGYGYGEERGITPDSLREQGIAPYILTESCRRTAGSDARGVVDPWTALTDDLANLGTITGTEARAQEVAADLAARLTTLRQAPQAGTPPTIFLFDSGTDSVYSSGGFCAPQAIIAGGGGRNALDDVDDTWTEVSWERVAASSPTRSSSSTTPRSHSPTRSPCSRHVTASRTCRPCSRTGFSTCRMRCGPRVR